jgi:hypothetical protein
MLKRSLTPPSRAFLASRLAPPPLPRLAPHLAGALRQHGTTPDPLARDGQPRAALLSPQLLTELPRYVWTQRPPARHQPLLIRQIAHWSAWRTARRVLGARQGRGDELRREGTRFGERGGRRAPAPAQELGVQLPAICHHLGVY